MPRLIDADALLMDNSWAFYDENGNRNEACIAVENAPTVDAVEVVRCKDCKYYDGGYRCCATDIWTNPNGYCHYGERREDAE